MFKRVLVPIDGSVASLKSAEIAAGFLRKNCAQHVTLLHVALNPQETIQFESFYTRPEFPHFHEELLKKVEESANHILDQARIRFEPDMQFDTLIKYGPPAETICDIAQKDDYDLIIIGNRGLNKLQRLLLGSISSKVTTLARCPVLIVK